MTRGRPGQGRLESRRSSKGVEGCGRVWKVVAHEGDEMVILAERREVEAKSPANDDNP